MNATSSPNSIQTSATDEIDLGQLLGTIWRGKLWILLAGFVTLLAGGYYAFAITTPLYTTTASVVQVTEQELVVDFSASLGGRLGGDQSAINTEILVLRSRALLEKLVAELDLIRDPEFNEELRPEPVISLGQAVNLIRKVLGFQIPEERQLTSIQIRDAVVGNLRDALSISNIRQSYVFSITATTQDAVKSTQIVNVLADLYILDQVNLKGESNLAATTWLTDRLGQLRVELETAEAAVKDFSAQTNLINIDTLAALNRQVKDLRGRLEVERTSLIDLEAHIANLKTARASGDPQQMADVVQDRTLNGLFGEIDPQSPEGRSAFDARFEQLDTQSALERSRLQSQIVALETSVEQQAQATDQQSVDLITLQQLEREAEASRLLYAVFPQPAKGNQRTIRYSNG